MKLTKLIAMAFLSIIMLSYSFAGASNTWQGKGRIALSSDGNKHDNDDMQATMMTLMILAKAGLQSNTVLYTYADHIWASEDNDLSFMKESAEGGGERFGFQNTRFMAAVTNPEAAYNAFRDEIVKSTADNPLFIIAAGPMQVIGEGLKRANTANPASLNHVTVISHSKWNEKHSDNPSTGAPQGWEQPHSGWTWEEMKSSFGSKVNFNHITDQNGSGNKPYESKDKFSAPSWDKWAWMNTHKDPNVKWVYTRGKSNPSGPDYSDAGMAYYFCADLNGVRGDDFGNPVKLEKWIGPDVIPVVIDPAKVSSVNLNTAEYHIKTIGGTYTLSATVMPTTATNKSVIWSSSNPAVATVSSTGLVKGIALGNATITVTTVDNLKTALASIQVGEVTGSNFCVGDDFICFEADATNSPLGKWVVRKKGDNDYISGTSGVAPIGNDYLEYTGGNENGNSEGQDVLVYKFTPKTNGTYRLTGRMAQNQNGAAWDKCNDIYVKMAGDFTAGSGSASLAQLKAWAKLYGRGFEDWGAFVKGDIHEVKYNMRYVLKAGVEYTFSVSGRAQRTCIDYYLFVKEQSGVTIAEKADLATNTPERMRPTCEALPTDCLTINAHDFDITSVSGYDPATKNTIPNSPANGVNKGENVIGCSGTNGTARPIAAEETYTGSPANVTFTVKAVGEPDGECTYAVYLNGTKVGEKKATRIHGTSTPAYTYESLKINTTPVAIKSGDVIRVTSNQTSNNLVAEGSGYATARGRWASLDICGGEVENVEEAVSIVSLPASVSNSQLEIPVKVSYTANESRDINVAIKKSDNTFVKNNKVTVNAGSGETTITVTLDTPLAIANGYKVNVALRPLNGNWETNIKESNSTFNVIIPATQTAYPTTHIIPGRIESENFDNGGEGIAYHDTDVTNNGGKGRVTESVDVETCTEGGLNAGWVAGGEWFEYTVDVKTTGEYDMLIRYAAKNEDGNVDITIGNTEIQGIDLPKTTGWQTYNTVTKTVTLKAGKQVIRLTANAKGSNFNYIEFKTLLPENLVKNFGFETGDFSSWINYGSVNVSTDADERTYGAHIVGKGAVEQVINVEPNTNYILSASAKVDNGKYGALGIKEYGGTEKSSRVTNTSYSTISLSFTTGNQSTAKIYFYVHEVSTNTWVDNFSLTKSAVKRTTPDRSSNHEISVYPNPFDSELSLELEESHLFSNVQIIDMTGRIIYSQNASNQTNINLGNSPISDASSGIYFIRLSGETNKMIKVIKR